MTRSRLFLTLAAVSVYLVSASQAFTHDKVVIEPIAVLSQKAIDETLDSLGSKSLAQGRLESKPGSVFTEGSEEKGMALPYLTHHTKSIPYPRWAIRQGWQGRFSIALEILTDGRVGRSSVIQSTGYRMLDEAAAKAIQTWKFHPAMQNGKPAVACIQLPVVFQLEKE